MATKRQIRRGLIALLATMTVLGLVTVGLMLYFQEPFVDGRPISVWIEEFAGPVNAGYGQVASQAVPSLIEKAPGPQIAPALGSALDRGLTGVDRLFLKFYPKLPGPIASRLSPPNPGRDVQLRYRAALILYYMQSNAAPAVPDLIEALEDDPNPEVRRVAAGALGNVTSDPAATAAIEGALTDSAAAVRQAALESAARFEQKTVAAKHAATLLSDPEPAVRRDAAKLLKNLGPHATAQIQPLTAALSDPNDDVLRFAAQALGKIGPEARDAIPALQAALDEYRPHTETTLRWALRQIE